MANTLYKVLNNGTLMYKKASIFSGIITLLSTGTFVDVISISNGWAYCMYNNKNGYILSSKLQLVTGSVTIKYIDENNLSIFADKVYSNLPMGTYSYSAIAITGYTLTSTSPMSVTLSKTNLKPIITFKYKKNIVVLTGSVTINYVDQDTNKIITTSDVYSNLSLGSYSYSAKTFDEYYLVSNQTQSVTLTSENKDQIIIFFYRVLGSVTINYINEDTNQLITSSEIYNNLFLDTYIYTAKTFEGYLLYSNETQSVTLTSTDKDKIVNFYYRIACSITISYIDDATNQQLAPNDVYSNLLLGSYTYDSKIFEGYTLVSSTPQNVTLTEDNRNQIIIFNYKKTTSDIYNIDLIKFGISNYNSNGTATTKGINNALRYAKDNGFSKVKLPEGIYAIDMTEIQAKQLFKDSTGASWIHNVKGVILPSDIEFDITGCTLQQVPCEETYFGIVNFSMSDNSKLIGGKIIGDKYTHDYGLRINWDENSLESGDIDPSTGLLKEDVTRVRTNDYITEFKPGEPLPNKFYICPFDDTTKNTVDGGVRYIFCYDANDKYLGLTTGGNGFLSQATLLSGTTKIKVSFKDEKRLDAKYYLTKRTIYYTYEFGFGIEIANSHNNEINGTEIRECHGDCICTLAPPLKVTVDNLNIINCILEDSRRQGISFTATGENYLIQGCKIGKISGVDPQCGIDFEHYDYCKNTIVDNCEFYDNKKWDIINYNGTIIEVKNSNFTGAIATTYGHTMDIHHNTFNYKDRPKNDKIFKSSGVSSSAKNLVVHNNLVTNGFMGSFSGSDSYFYDNTCINTNVTIYTLGENCYDNDYTGGTIRYGRNNTIYSNEVFNNCTVSGENNGVTDSNGNKIDTRTLNNCKFNNCNFVAPSSLLMTYIKNSTIYNSTATFNNVWAGAYTVDACIITTEFNDNTSFIANQGSLANFINCTMNLAMTPFVALNYKSILMENCTIKFKQGFGTCNNTTFYTNVYGTANFSNNKFFKDFSTPTIKLPKQTNGTINEQVIEDNIEIIV